jgi:hypothetical protein
MHLKTELQGEFGNGDYRSERSEVAQNSMNVQKAFRQLATLFSDPDAQPINR